MSVAKHMEPLLTGFGVSVVADGYNIGDDTSGDAPPRQGLQAVAAQTFRRGDLVLRAVICNVNFEIMHPDAQIYYRSERYLRPNLCSPSR